MKVTDITARQVEDHIHFMSTEPSIEDSFEDRILEAFCKSDIGKDFAACYFTRTGCHPAAFAAGFYEGIRFVKRLQEAEELEAITKL